MSRIPRRQPIGLRNRETPIPRNHEEARYRQLERVLRLMQRLEGRAYCPPLHNMAAELGVCTRTVRRYLDTMSVAGVHVPPLFTEYERESSPIARVVAGGVR